MDTGRTAGRSVLVIDSFEDSATTLALVLGLYGHTVHVAFDAAAAVAAANEARPEVIVMDPWRIAADLIGRLAARAGGKPLLIALTGYVRPRDRGRVPGFDHTLLKPCDAEALAWLIDSGAQARRNGGDLAADPTHICERVPAETDSVPG